MGDLTLNIPVDQSPIPAALDAYYAFLKKNIPIGADDKIAILGTILEYDITKKSILYNDYVVRAFSDRTVRASPVTGQAAGDIADRYSSLFTDAVSELVAETDAELTDAQQGRIDRYEAAINAISDDRDAYITKIEDAWTDFMQKLGIDPTKIDTDKTTRQRYVDERVKFLTERRFAQKMWGTDGFNTKIRGKEISIAAVRRKAFPDKDYAQLYHMYESCLDDLVVRPRQPDLEIIHNWDAFTIQDPTNFAMTAVFDIAVETTSIVDPRTILDGKGKRHFSVDIESKVTNEHDQAWNVSGSGSYMSFVSGSFSAADSNHFKSTVEHIRKITVSFEHLGELQLMRDRWFASTALSDNKRLARFLKQNPTLASKLTLLTTGLIIGRGLKIILEFKDSSDVQEWGSSSDSGSAGVNICGYQLGGSGGGSSSYNNHQIDINNKTVTFDDGASVCRLVGLRMTPLKIGRHLTDVMGNGRLPWQIPSLRDAAHKLLKAGKIPDREALELSEAEE